MIDNLPPDVVALIAATRQMRSWQRHYFQTRDRVALQNSKYHEREVDKILARLPKGEEPDPPQRSLFGGGHEPAD